MAVEIRIDGSISVVPTTVYGGGRLRTCTAGFAVASPVDLSRRGVTTARHCDDDQTYAGRDGLTWTRTIPRVWLDVVVWPAGTELLTGDEPGVRIPDVGDVAVGEMVSAGGGWNPIPDDWAPGVPDRCLATADNDIAMIRQSSSSDS